MVSVVQWAIFASSPIFMEPPDCVLDLVVASRCLLDHKSSQEATMPNASPAGTHRHEHGESCAHAHPERVSEHAHGHDHGHAGHQAHAHAHAGPHQHAHDGGSCGHDHG